MAVVSVSLHALRDIDLYWHLLAGQALAEGTSPRELGAGWSYAPVDAQWTSTQWLSELLLHAVHRVAGWTGLAALRVITAAVAIAILARTTLRGRPPILAGFPYVVAVFAIAVASQERPQQATLVGAALLGGVLVTGVVRSQLPRWYVVLPVTILWANLHGGCILLPATLGLIALGRWVDLGPGDRLGWRAAGLTGVTLLCAAITPAGLAGLTAPMRFQAATGLVQEWQRTTPVDFFGLLTILMLAFVAVGWVRSMHVPYSEFLAFFACLILAWSAWRNIAPAMAMAAPLVAHRLSLAFPNARRAEPRWSVPIGIALASVLSLLSVIGLMNRDHLPVQSQPIGLARQIGQLPPGQRVLNDYNTSGVVLYFGGPDVQVGIDGRADRYGADYIEDYVGLRALEGDWEDLLVSLDPTSALFEEDTPIVHVLEAERGWTVIGREEGWVLLVPEQ
ncbi:MAG: hypothetical protein WCF36_14555 [Candidatus Nanopelagicales bacterium]